MHSRSLHHAYEYNSIHAMNDVCGAANAATLARRLSVPQFEKGGYNGHAAYALSKLLDIMFNAELAKRAPRGVTCNALHPGVVNTKMLREGWGVGGNRVEK